ncbi:M24 family metallopeptidase, partial [Corynebacterium sp.]|uniref:M24 family metallopeptidase n=1 Tax=Corynebacterium sp. TaxID=1720 RepID=UPI002A91E82A
MAFRRRTIAAKTPAELDAMEAAGRIVGQALVEVKAAARPGVSTLDLDRVAEEVIRSNGAVPTFLGYQGFTGSICASVNDVVVHGIPSADVVLKDGDLVSIDCGATFEGWVGDSAWSFGVGQLEDDVDKLNRATEWVLAEGMKAMVPGNRLTDVSHALEQATYAAEEK